MNFGESALPVSSDEFSIMRTTIELPIDDILNGADTFDQSSPSTSNRIEISQNNYISPQLHLEAQSQADI